MTTIERAIEAYGKDMQLNVAIEELSELIKEICKYKRGSNNRKNIIEEMTEDLHRAYAINKLYTEDVANYLYEAGYRKSTDVAREIFEEIENIAILNGYISVKDFYTEHPLIAELKKKYTEGGN